jgi:FkbM family methyltransferase
MRNPIENKKNLQLHGILLESGLRLQGEKILIDASVKSIRFDVGMSRNAPNSAVWISRDPKMLILGFEPVQQNRQALYTNEGVDNWLTEINLAKFPRLALEFLSHALNRLPFQISSEIRKLLRRYIDIQLPCKTIRKNVFVMGCALGSAWIPEGAKFYITEGDSGCSSLLEPIDIEVKTVEKVQVLTLAQFIESLPEQCHQYLDYLKIDAQGSDLEILKGLGDHIKKFKGVTVECVSTKSAYKNETNQFLSVSNYLDSMGFKIFINSPLNSWKLARKKIFLEVDDPTFLNTNWIEKNQRKPFWAYQRS